MIGALIDGLSWACLVAAGALCCIGALGLLRMPDFYTRMHAASIVDTLGAGLVLLGLILQAGLTLVAVKLVMIGFLLPKAKFESADEADALAIAICHANHRGVRRLAAAAK